MQEDRDGFEPPITRDVNNQIQPRLVEAESWQEVEEIVERFSAALLNAVKGWSTSQRQGLSSLLEQDLDENPQQWQHVLSWVLEKLATTAFRNLTAPTHRQSSDNHPV